MSYFDTTRVSEKLRWLHTPHRGSLRWAPVAIAALAIAVPASAQTVGSAVVDAPSAIQAEAENAGSVRGTVVDANGQIVPAAKVVLHSSATGDREVTANSEGAFEFNGLPTDAPYRVTASAKGFTTWNSSEIVLKPGQFRYLTDVQLGIPEDAVSVTVYGSPTEIAEEQLHAEEQQRVLGIIPNFYVVYDSSSAVPLTAKMKFKLAMKLSTDPMTAAGVLTVAGSDQLSHRLDYPLGAKGYGQRVGAVSADAFSDILIGGVILPSVLHQDPRYFYQGSGTTKSRLRHAVSSPFITRGENGHMQPNFSSIGGDLASSALSMTYYPDSNRSAGMVFQTFGIDTAERVASAVAQEFIIPRLMLRRPQH